jgi:hypothetical protein
MRNLGHHASALACLVFLVGLACTPDTDLGQAQAALLADAATDRGNATLSSAQVDPLAGQLVEPPPGSTGIATNLGALTVRFTEPVQAAGAGPPFLLRAPDGGELALALGGAVPCSQTCYQIGLDVELRPTTAYALESVVGALQFLDGKPVPAGPAGGFTTADTADRFAPRIEAFTATASAGCLSVHLVADEAVRVELTLTAGPTAIVLPTGDFLSTLDLVQRLPDPITGPSVEVVAQVFDRPGNATRSAAVGLGGLPPLPHLTITEVLANPAGSETTQEFVELYNAGRDPVALGGLLIADKSGSDALPEASLAVGAFAVVVGENYNVAEGGDVPPIEGATVVRVPGRIGSDGLTNTGETVRLLTAAGDVISEYGGWVDTSASAWSGKSVKRSSPDACDTEAAWSTTPTPATPGW